MTARLALMRENLMLLEQAAAVLSALPEEVFLAEREQGISSVAKHFRHVFDHYEALLGCRYGKVDYETRERGTDVEKNPAAARHKAAFLLRELQKLCLESSETTELQVERLIRAADGRLSTVFYPTSFERELDFVHQHTVHHFAIIALLLRRHGWAVAPDFGLSPATLRFNAAVAASA